MVWKGDSHVQMFERWSGDPKEPPVQDYCEWNPLTDDGDALRLAVKLDISVFGHFPLDAVAAFEGRRIIEKKNPVDPMLATRRAIVRAAAAIGERAS